MEDSDEPKDPSGSDRRRDERVPINREFARLADEAATWVSDLSEGGVFVHSRDQLPVGSIIELRFTVLLDDPVVVEATGTVVRHSLHPRGMGIAFAGVSPDMVARIHEVLQRQRPHDPGRPIRRSSLAPIETHNLSARHVRSPDDEPTKLFVPPPLPRR
ncbi:PilZ domain-containing protein [Nannocystaceae bacterium ST9]